MSGDIFDVSETAAEEQDQAEESSFVFVEQSIYNDNEEETKTAEDLEDEDALAEAADFHANYVAVEDEILSDDEDSAFVGAEAGDVAGVGAQAEAMVEEIPAVDLGKEGLIYWIGYEEINRVTCM